MIQPTKTYYLSFAHSSKPKGEQFQGACVVRATDEIEAVKRAHQLGINPGGQVLMILLTPEEEARCPIPFDKLLSKEDLLKYGGVRSVAELEQYREMEDKARAAIVAEREKRKGRDDPQH